MALNSDDSVARLKGPDRPVNPLPYRARVVGAIKCAVAEPGTSIPPPGT